MNIHTIVAELASIRTQLNTLIAAIQLTPSNYPDETQAIKNACQQTPMPAKGSTLAAYYQQHAPHLSMHRAATILRSLGYTRKRQADGNWWHAPNASAPPAQAHCAPGS